MTEQDMATANNRGWGNTMTGITPKNWDSFQHYKNRSPAWIKLHRGLLDDFEFARLPVASRALAPLLWLLASEYDDGKITASIDELAFRFRMPENELRSALTPLINSGFFNASALLAECKQDACLEREEEEEDIDKRERREDTREVALYADAPDFDEFWGHWPHKVGKPAAMKAYASAMKRGTKPSEIVEGVGRYIAAKPPDRPWLNPATFLNQNRWEDKPAATGAPNAKSGNIAAACDNLVELVNRGFGGAASQDGFSGREDEAASRLLSYGRR